MLTRHHGLLILLLFAVAAHASLVERWFGRQPPGFQIGFAVLLAPILLVLLGEWIAEDATTITWRKRGFLVAGFGALWHLVLDLLSLSLLNQPEQSRLFLLAGLASGALVMGLVLRRAARGVFEPEAAEPDPAQAPADETLVARVQREAALIGGTPLVLFLISLGFVVLAGVGIVRSPQALPKLIGAGGFFLLCGAIAVWMGLERRAMLLRQPSPFAGLRPRFLQRTLVVPTQDGVAFLDRKGATVYVWDQLRGVSLGEYQGNAAVFVDLSESAQPRRYSAVGQPLDADAAWLRKQSWNRSLVRTLCDCDLLIMGVATPSGPGVLADQLGTLLTDYDGRAALPTVAEALADFLRPKR